ncbi:MAG: hypothetical protein WCO00_17185 [Rhodospirillaceae bacterium]
MTDAAADPSPASPRTVLVDGQCHAIGLDDAVWAAFDEYCTRERVTRAELAARAALRLGDEPLADKIVGLLTAYFKDAADRDPPPAPGLSEDGAEPRTLSPALRAGLDALGK